MVLVSELLAKGNGKQNWFKKYSLYVYIDIFDYFEIFFINQLQRTKITHNNLIKLFKLLNKD